MMGPVSAACWGLALALALAALTWLASLPLRDASLADRVWPLLIAAPALLYAGLLPAPALPPAPGGWMLALLLLWALRLAAYITWRNRGHGEDRRYAAMRAQHGAAFAARSLVTVFGLQAVLAWLVSAPLLAALAAVRGAPALGLLGVAGACLTLGGTLLEAVADRQLARHRADPSRRGTVLDRGLWRFSRHPNYFGEACVWWGLWLMALDAGGTAAAWSVLSPALMTFLLLRVSGVRLLEADLAARRPAYRDYVARTSAFVPWPPRR